MTITGIFSAIMVRNASLSATLSPVSSWNPSVSCSPTVMTLEQVVGTIPNPSQHAPSQGADYSGGALSFSGVEPPGVVPPSSSWPFSKRSLSPPCNASTSDGKARSTFVEIHNVRVTGISHDECGSVYAGICDETFNVCNTLMAPSCSNMYPSTMHKIYAEIDMMWIHAANSPQEPSPGSIIDIQGFVFWDDAHVSETWHSFSGWEIHPVTAWRISIQHPTYSPLTTGLEVSSITTMIAVEANSIVLPLTNVSVVENAQKNAWSHAHSLLVFRSLGPLSDKIGTISS